MAHRRLCRAAAPSARAASASSARRCGPLTVMPDRIASCQSRRPARSGTTSRRAPRASRPIERRCEPPRELDRLDVRESGGMHAAHRREVAVLAAERERRARRHQRRGGREDPRARRAEPIDRRRVPRPRDRSHRRSPRDRSAPRRNYMSPCCAVARQRCAVRRHPVRESAVWSAIARGTPFACDNALMRLSRCPGGLTSRVVCVAELQDSGRRAQRLATLPPRRAARRSACSRRLAKPTSVRRSR